MTNFLVNLAKHLKTHFGFEHPDIEPIGSGEENQNYKVTLPHHRYLLRVYSTNHSTTGERSKLQIEQEHRLIEHLASQGMPTSLPVKSNKGYSIFDGPDKRLTTLFKFVDGRHPTTYNKKVANEVGRLLHNLRDASKSFTEPATRQWSGDTPEIYLEAFHSISSKFSATQQLVLNKMATSVESSLNEINNLERGYIHGDIKLGNLLFTADGELSAVIDFDDFREGFLLEELARTLMHDLHNPEQNVIRSGFATEMIKAYAPNEQESFLLKYLLQARFLYDVGSYIYNDLENLVNELLTDQNITHLFLD